MVEVLLISFIGGLIGAVFMDIAEFFMSKFGIKSGVSANYIGRWVVGLVNGVFVYKDISKTTPVKNEVVIAQIFHYIVGGGIIAIFYPLILKLLNFNEPVNHLLFATLFGIFTSILPWFILMPSFGWGVFGLKNSNNTYPIISPIISHITYGFGIGLVLTLVYK